MTQQVDKWVSDDGSVTLFRGDCTSILPTLPTGCVDVLIDDPPFGARRPSARRLAGERFSEIQGNATVDTGWISEAVRVLADGAAAYVFTCWDVMQEWRQSMAEAGLRVRSCIVWDKMLHGLADLETCWAPQHEFILFGAKGRHVLAGKRPKDILRHQRLSPDKLLHPYQKPVGLIQEMLESSVGTVADFHMGSGTTGEAAVSLGRPFIGCEIDPHHFETARDRIRAELKTRKDSLFDPVPYRQQQREMFAETA